MNNQVKFYQCKHCKNIFESIQSSGIPVFCCGEEMEEIIANTVEASKEKHIPVVERNGDEIKIKVGAQAHPMLPEHYIQWIAVVNDNISYRKMLSPGEQPIATFKIEAGMYDVYAYCNIHGLWKTNI